MIFNRLEYDIISSTNDEAKRLIEADRIKPTLILAKQQTRGRGRGEHIWDSSHIGNIYSSYCFEVGEVIKDLPQITLLAGLAVKRAMVEVLKRHKVNNYVLDIKWPNDLLLNHKKIVGILTELAKHNQMYYVIIGIGINIDWGKREIEQANLSYAGSICELVNKKITLSEVQSQFEKELGRIADEFLTGNRFETYFDEYNAYLLNKDKILLYEEEGKTEKGLCLGVDKEGYLIIKNQDNSVKRINFGEINIRGVYGY